MKNEEFLKKVIAEVRQLLVERKVDFFEPISHFSKEESTAGVDLLFRFSTLANAQGVRVRAKLWNVAHASPLGRCVVYGSPRLRDGSGSCVPATVAMIIVDEATALLNE